jgi:hypothetical protein
MASRSKTGEIPANLVNGMIFLAKDLGGGGGGTEKVKSPVLTKQNFLPSPDSKAVCRRLRKHFLTPPSLSLPSRHH